MGWIHISKNESNDPTPLNHPLSQNVRSSGGLVTIRRYCKVIYMVDPYNIWQSSLVYLSLVNSMNER